MQEQTARRKSEDQYAESEERTAGQSNKTAGKKKKKSPFGPGALAILILVCMILGVMGYRIYNLKQKEIEISQQIDDLTLQKEEETQRAEELEQLATEYQSDDYKERIARSKLGLANDNEIIFKESEE